MFTTKVCRRLVQSTAFAAALIVVLPAAQGQSESVLHSFTNNTGRDGSAPCGGLTFDAAGNLYGTTTSGGANSKGTVYELMPGAGGSWTEVGLHTFGNGNDGAYPYGNLIFDAAGNLYGTSDAGGAYGYGTVYELSPKAGGGWTEKVLHSFGNNNDGEYPSAGLIFDAAGNLYGTAEGGGSHESAGAIYELSPVAGKGWKESVIHSFGLGKDGAEPQGSLTFDAAGNLYGATYFGGSKGDGMAFELSPKVGGGWAETELHSFQGSPNDAYLPIGSLIFDAGGNLYGASYKGGPGNVGTVFELTKGDGGPWTSSLLHKFENNGVDGYYPEGNLIFDASGNLYGTAPYGGIDGDGVVYEMTPEGGGVWSESLPLTFNDANGALPCSGLIFDSSGNLYSTTLEGGAHNGGTVFELTP